MAKLGTVIATLENNLSESGILGATEDALQAEQTATDVAEGNAEQIKEVEEIDSTDTGIEDAFEAEGHIENLLDAAEQTLADGGMSEKEAKLLEISHESIMSSIGMGHRTSGFVSNPVLSLESYGSARTRASATMVTMEKLGESLKTIGANIIKALKAALDTVMSFLSGLLKNRAILAKHLDNLLKRAADLDTANNSRKQEEFATGAAALSIGGAASTATARNLLKSASAMVMASGSIAGEVAQVVDAADAVSSVKAALGGPIHGTNGRTLSVSEKDGGLEIKWDEGKKAEKIAAPSRDDIIDLLKRAKKVLEDLRAVERSQTKFRDGVNKVIARLSEVASQVRSKVGSEESKKEQEEAAKAKKAARVARSIMTKAGASLPQAAFSAVKAVADYCAAGIRNYGKDEKK